MYLPGEAQDQLFEQISELSAPGSRIAVESAGNPQSEERREELRARFEKFADQLGLHSALDIQELMYDDPDRADVAQWLGGHGWQADAVQSRDEMQRLGRLVDLPDADGNGFSTFVTAVRG